ncbi:MAG: type ISP restriction/modification enzyme, partial [bacterium]
QLRSPVEVLFNAFSGLTRGDLVLKGESLLAGRLGRPDFALHAGITPIGYIELKAPGKGVNPERFSGHDHRQWEKFKNVPNLLYADGNSWALYRDGKRIDAVVTLGGDITADGKHAVSATAAASLFELLATFTSWTPVVPKKPSAIAAFLAPYCRLLRDEVTEALGDSASPMHQLKGEVKDLLFPEASDEQFADAYAQTVLFALLLARMEGADTLDLNHACDTLNQEHLLLARSLQFLTDPVIRKEIEVALDMIRRVIAAIAPDTLRAKSAEDDPWLFFYEQFLAAYDPALRKDAGAYYTPLEVVRCQVRLVDELLVHEFKETMGFVEPDVVTLDPAVGTGTYLLGIIEHAQRRIEAEEGKGAVKGGARMLAVNLHGFEWLVGPYAVAQLRVTQALKSYDIAIGAKGVGIFLTNTLESPHTVPPTPTLFHQPIADEHRRALKIKGEGPVLVCIGNPPYDRHDAANAGNQAATGGWVRYGDGKDHGKFYRWLDTRREGRIRAAALLEDYLEPVRKAGLGVHLKNLYNLYVYFVRWSLWKTFEQEQALGPGIVSFITASSYLDGDAFIGLREHLRRLCERVDIIDLGGEGRGTRQDENIFAIQTPVCIFIAWRASKKPKDAPPAQVRYVRIAGTRQEKLAALDAVGKSADLPWEPVPDGWRDPFKPEGRGKFFKWPQLTNLMPWQNNGVQCKRTWPIGPSDEVLKARWTALLKSDDRNAAMKDSGDRNAQLAQPDLFDPAKKLLPLKAIPRQTPPAAIVPYAYRSFDRQYLLADNRLISRPRPPLWAVHGKRQLFFATIFSQPVGDGPALTCCGDIPDLDFFRGSYGAKNLLPLYRDREGLEPNLTPGLTELLSRRFQREVTAEDMAAYLYAILAQPAYTARFHEQLGRCELRVPFTKDAEIFFKVAEAGRQLLWRHTYGERFADTAKKRPDGQIPRGTAKCLTAVPDTPEGYPDEFNWNEATQTLQVGEGTFGPVTRGVYEFEVSGLKVVQSWLGYRMKNRKGKKSSPLDDIRPACWTREFTRGLLELLWVLEATVKGYPEQAALLEEVLAGPLFTAGELPPVPGPARKPPAGGNDPEATMLRDAAQPYLLDVTE